MFREIFRFEVSNGLRKPSLYVYFGLLFLLTLSIGMAGAGVFSTTRVDSNLFRNSALSVANILLGSGGSIFSLFFSVILISMMATAIQKDYQYNAHPLFFTKPVTKPGYFLGRFLGAFALCLMVFSALPLGYWIGTLFGMGKPMMGPFRVVNFLQPFLMFTLPNILFLGVLFFSLTTFLRTTMAAYIVAIVLMVLSIVSETVMTDMENKTLAAMLEPTGSRALSLVTEYWSPAERNANLIPLTGPLLYNRLLWMGFALLIAAASYAGFGFSQFLQPLRLFRRNVTEAAVPAPSIQSLAELPKVSQDYSPKAMFRQAFWLSGFEYRKMTRNVLFVVMCLLSIGVLLLVVRFMDSIFEAPTYLVTYKVVESVEGAAIFFLIVYITFQAGTAVWRDRESKTDELVGVTPVSNGVLFLSKLIGCTLACGLLLAIVAGAGVAAQLYSGFRDIDFMQYLVMTLRNTAVVLVFVAFALAFQVYSGNKYFGFFLTLLPLLIIPIVLGLLEVSNPLLDYNGSGSSQPYSDMNGYGAGFRQWPVFRVYWWSIAAVLSVLAFILYPRGKEKSLKARWRLTPASDKGVYRNSILAATAVMLASGGYIFYQNHVLQDDTRPKVFEKESAELEKKFGRYRNLPQPRITEVDLKVDIHPSSQELEMSGSYMLMNRRASPMDTLYIDYPSGKKSRYRFSVLKPSVPFTVAVDEKAKGILILKLAKPLAPGDSLQLHFEMAYRPNGSFDRISSPVVGNGTFFNNMLLPTIGYNPSSELTQNTARKEYGLPPRPRTAKLDDSVALQNNYISRDADWIRFRATVGTEEGQTAIAPGYLQRDWKKDGRHYFEYRMDSPILNFYSFLSACYEVKSDRWNDVAIEVYHHKGHVYNIDRMIRGVKKSLDYYTSRFGPYQHRQVRIVEFPRYQSFAQSFPNTIPYSESIGFITRVDTGRDDIDVPFYVTAHEVAHQWWAHQVISGDVQGSALLSETLSQYSALMVMQQEYGRDAMRKFLKYEMDRYLLGRATEFRGELPLMLCENQQYIHYNKGSVVMYALMDYLGEERLNGAIRSFLEETRFSGPPYPNAATLVKHIKAVTPDSLQYLVRDMFERITIYENYVSDLSTKTLADGSHQVTLTVGSAKFHSDSLGKKTQAAVLDYMDVGVFTEVGTGSTKRDSLITLQRVKMDQPEKTFTFVTKHKPVSAGIDPYLKLIDRTPANNTAKFGEKPKKPDLTPNGGEFMFNFGTSGS